MTLEWGPKGQPPHTKDWTYLYDTPEKHVDEWLGDGGAPFGVEMSGGIETIAGRMVQDLLSPGAR